MVEYTVRVLFIKGRTTADRIRRSGLIVSSGTKQIWRRRRPTLRRVLESKAIAQVEELYLTAAACTSSVSRRSRLRPLGKLPHLKKLRLIDNTTDDGMQLIASASPAGRLPRAGATIPRLQSDW